MPNKLIRETSPYLRQHAHNPVDWYPWGEEALQKARREDKPIFLSIGYAACHWCHVMEAESFENPNTAALLNRSFVSIKVDREERPDLDMIYMQAVIRLSGSGGWPMSVFLTPEGSPFYGGTYFPPTRRRGLSAFPEILEAVARLWVEDRPRLLGVSAQVDEAIRGELAWGIPTPGEISPGIAAQAAQSLLAAYDWTHGGWGRAPRFPAPMTIDFLLGQAAVGSKNALEPALHALRSMSRGGMYDLVGGGFHRYSTDDEWFIPHFEKMLYDNAQLAQAALHAFQLSEDASLRSVCEETLEFIQAELTDPQGGFYSSLDADSEGVEGKYYTWEYPELQQALSPAEFALLSQACEIRPAGNFEGRILLRRVLPAAPGPDLKPIFHKLKALRAARIRPATDDKIIVAWNALALQSFAEAARALDRPDFLAAAQNNARFLLTRLRPDGRLHRSWCQGVTRQAAFLEDYAALVIALLALYQADCDPHWFQAALSLADEMVAGFRDPAGGFFVTHAAEQALLIRPKDLQDNPTPSGNALAAAALLQIHAYQDRPDWLALAEQAVASFQGLLTQYPGGFSYWLKTLAFLPENIRQVALTYPAGQPLPLDILARVHHAFRPDSILACAAYPLPEGAPALLQDRVPLNGLPTVFICKNFTCALPLAGLAEISPALADLS